MAQQGFIAFTIDYRLACTDTGVYLCGFNFPVPIDDVETAMSWVRDNAGNYASFTQQVALLGTSAGGNLGGWQPRPAPTETPNPTWSR